MKIRIKKDWWFFNSLLLFLSGILGIYKGYFLGVPTAGIVIGGIDILLGVALLQKSKLAFWFVFGVAAYNLFKFLPIITSDTSWLSLVGLIIKIAMLVFVLMLWRQIKRETRK